MSTHFMSITLGPAKAVASNSRHQTICGAPSLAGPFNLFPRLLRERFRPHPFCDPMHGVTIEHWVGSGLVQGGCSDDIIRMRRHTLILYLSLLKTRKAKKSSSFSSIQSFE
jgi:hypothetical protein